MSNLNKTNQPFSVNDIFVNNILDDERLFENKALEIFRFQYKNNKVYKQWCDAFEIEIDKINCIEKIPFLPISFFKTHKVISSEFKPEIVFESSGTTQTISSKHFVKHIFIYKKSFLKAFELFYGNVKNYCIIGLLPSYLERKNSSLVMMVDELIKLSHHSKSGFYLYEFDRLQKILKQLENDQQKTLLIGVTFALLNFAEVFPMQLNHTTIMETGGMKGRRKELTRIELHNILQDKFGVKNIHSEYGMTELLSQAFSKNDGKFYCSPWMKVLIRNEQDPFAISPSGKGILNIIDLANIYSCSFIATDDVGIVHKNSSFEILGRLDNTDIRGCSLLIV
ncbi:MAG: acyl transferase [Chitinophagaceae bacterium]